MASLPGGCSHQTQSVITAKIIKVAGKNDKDGKADTMVLVAQGPNGERGTKLVSSEGQRCHRGDLIDAREMNGSLWIDPATCRPAKSPS